MPTPTPPSTFSASPQAQPIPYQQDAPTNWFRGAIQGKTRIALAWAFAAALGLTAKNFPGWITQSSAAAQIGDFSPFYLALISMSGVLLCFAGATLRYRASGYLRKDRRPAVGGPYAWVRNPLYLGTYMMALGVGISISSWVLAAVIAAVYPLLYHFIILDEEIKLKQIFGAPYLVYLNSVPRFFPKLIPWPQPGKPAFLLQVNPDPEVRQFSPELAKQNRALEAYWSFLGLMAYAALAFAIRSQFFASKLPTLIVF